MGILVLAILLFAAVPAPAQTTLGAGASTGDQLLFFYDARTNRVPFLTIGNPGAEAIQVEVAFYPQDLSARLGESILEVPGRGNVVVSPTEEAGGVANGQAGLAVVTPVANAADRRPIVPPNQLMGSYTIANTSLGAGFGENATGRAAVNPAGQRASVGTVVDGVSVAYQRLAPSVLMIPTYYNPGQLDPPESDGNRVILIAFEDRYGESFEVTPHSLTARATVMDTDGNTVVSRDVAVSAVVMSGLQSIAGGALLASSGKVFFAMDVGSGNAFGIFSQSLAAFGAGARMPAVAQGPGPEATPGPTATPTPMPTLAPGATPTPSPTPAVGELCGNGVVDAAAEECDGDDFAGSDCAFEVGGATRCLGMLQCNPDCTIDFSGCDCNCISDTDCDVDVDCEPFVPDCGEVFGVCEDGSCYTSPVGTAEICTGFDPDPDFPDFERCP